MLKVMLFIALVLAGLLMIAFFEWQVIRDPRIGNPIVLVTRLLETLGIFALSVTRWPGTIPTFLSITSLVNLNTEVFQTECLLGRPHPTGVALTYVCGIPCLFFLLLLLYPLLQHRKRSICYECDSSLESMCEPFRPGNNNGSEARMSFTPLQALSAANFSEYTKISLTVSLPNRALAQFRATDLLHSDGSWSSNEFALIGVR